MIFVNLDHPDCVTDAGLTENGEPRVDSCCSASEAELSPRLVNAYMDTTTPDATSDFQLHSHSFYEILYCRNNCGVEYLLGTKHYHLQKGDIIVISPDVSHRPLFSENMTEPYCRYVLQVSQEFMDQVTKAFPLSLPEVTLLRTARTDWEFLGDIFARGVQEAQEQAPQWETALLGNTLYLLSMLSRAALDEKIFYLQAEKPELLNRVLDYIETHLDEKISLKSTAQRFFVSQSTISQTFRKKMGISFYRCVTQRRLIAAKELIMQGMPLESVNERVGFSDYSTFYRAFKQEFGISPQQFRKQQVPPK